MSETEGLFPVLHRSRSGGLRCTRRQARHRQMSQKPHGLWGRVEFQIRSRMARGQHDAWVEEVEAIFEPVSATDDLCSGGTLRQPHRCAVVDCHGAMHTNLKTLHRYKRA